MKSAAVLLSVVVFHCICSSAAAFQPVVSRLPHKQHGCYPEALTSSRVVSNWQRKKLNAHHMSSSSNYDYISRPPAVIKRARATAVYALIMLNIGIFISDKVFRIPFAMRHFYLFHRRWSWWQPLTTCFCHSDRSHLSSNLFLLLLFGRSVEDDLGWGGLLLSYAFCGVLASMASLMLLPRSTVSIGASGAVFGLFAVSTFTKLSWRELFDWRKLVEMAVLGEY